MTNDQSNSLLRRAAIAAVGIALVTLTFGALVTSKNAGMAFADWPTSDGYLMVTYPWLSDFAQNWDKFLEHGHRLAGMLIGMWSILLVVVAYRTESRRWVRRLTVCILLGVICQGLLGGFRVQLDARGLAMLHGIFAAIVFAMMGTLCVATSKNWHAPQPVASTDKLTAAKSLAVGTLALMAIQYVLGSFIRHQGLALHEHRGLGILIGVVAAANVVPALRTGHKWIARGAGLLLAVVLGQVVLGFAAWFAKYGVPSLGIVATADSIGQVSLRTAHMVWGTVTLLTSVVYLLRILRVSAVSPQPRVPMLNLRPVSELPTGGTPA